VRLLRADVLRTRYVRLPRFVKAGVSPMVSLLPMGMRYGAAYHKLRQQLSMTSARPEFVRLLQLRTLRTVIETVQRRSPFYRERLAKVFGGPVDSRSFNLSDLARLPLVGRDDVAADPESLLVVERRTAELRQTSGSSGRPPLRIYLDRDRSVREMAFLHHIWSQAGYRLGDGRAILRDYGGHLPTATRKWHYDRALRELWLSPFDMREEVMDEYLALLHRFKVRWLYGVPSAINVLANHARRRDWSAPGCFKGVLPASETLFDNQRRSIAEVFGRRPILPFYGLSERVAIAGEILGQPHIYAFEPLYGITELIDEKGTPVGRVGQRGQIVATGFISSAMPLIRYQTGDYAELVAPASAETGYKLHVRAIASRWSQEFVFGSHGEPISVISLDSENYADVIRDYQYYQDTLGQVVLRLALCKGVRAERLEATLRPVHARVAGVLDISVAIVDRLPVGPTGKRAFVEQKLELPLMRLLGAAPEQPAMSDPRISLLSTSPLPA
jgi:phenylacetate-CoA ligase